MKPALATLADLTGIKREFAALMIAAIREGSAIVGSGSDSGSVKYQDSTGGVYEVHLNWGINKDTPDQVSFYVTVVGGRAPFSKSVGEAIASATSKKLFWKLTMNNKFHGGKVTSSYFFTETPENFARIGKGESL